MSVYDFAEELMAMDNEIWEEYGFQSRPSGEDRRIYLNAGLDKLERAGIDPDDLTDEVIYILEDENFHSFIDIIDIYLGRASIDGLMEKEYKYYA